MVVAMESSVLFYTYINIKNNLIKIANKNRGNYIYEREERLLRRHRSI